MDHQHFEKILVNDEPLAREEKAAFEAHLKVCASCAALAEVNRSLKHVAMAAPTPGFANRFQARLVAQRKAEKRRHLFGGLILLLGGLGFGIWLALPVLPAAIFSPAALLTSWVQTLASAISLIQAIFEAASVVTRVAAGFIPTETWALTIGLFSLLTLGWMISIQKTALPQAV